MQSQLMTLHVMSQLMFEIHRYSILMAFSKPQTQKIAFTRPPYKIFAFSRPPSKKWRSSPLPILNGITLNCYHTYHMAINMDIIGTYQTKCSWVNHLSVFACLLVYECVSVLRIVKQSQISWKPIQVCSCRTWSYTQNECSGQLLL